MKRQERKEREKKEERTKKRKKQEIEKILRFPPIWNFVEDIPTCESKGPQQSHCRLKLVHNENLKSYQKLKK